MTSQRANLFLDRTSKSLLTFERLILLLPNGSQRLAALYRVWTAGASSTAARLLPWTWGHVVQVRQNLIDEPVDWMNPKDRWLLSGSFLLLPLPWPRSSPYLDSCLPEPSWPKPRWQDELWWNPNAAADDQRWPERPVRPRPLSGHEQNKPLTPKSHPDTNWMSNECLTRPHSPDRSVTSQLTAAWTTGRLRFSAGSCYGGRKLTPSLSVTLLMAASCPPWTWGNSSRIRERTPHRHTPKVSSWPTSSTSGVRRPSLRRLRESAFFDSVWPSPSHGMCVFFFPSMFRSITFQFQLI